MTKSETKKFEPLPHQPEPKLSLVIRVHRDRTVRVCSIITLTGSYAGECIKKETFITEHSKATDRIKFLFLEIKLDGLLHCSQRMEVNSTINAPVKLKT